MANAIVAGVDMVKFTKPGKCESYRVMASTAIRGAMKDAGVTWLRAVAESETGAAALSGLTRTTRRRGAHSDDTSQSLAFDLARQ